VRQKEKKERKRGLGFGTVNSTSVSLVSLELQKRGLGFGAVNSTAASLVSLELHSLFNFYAKAGTQGECFLTFFHTRNSKYYSSIGCRSPFGTQDHIAISKVSLRVVC
jgi:hypothetical protein